MLTKNVCVRMSAKKILDEGPTKQSESIDNYALQVKDLLRKGKCTYDSLNGERTERMGEVN